MTGERQLDEGQLLLLVHTSRGHTSPKSVGQKSPNQIRRHVRQPHCRHTAGDAVWVSLSCLSFEASDVGPVGRRHSRDVGRENVAELSEISCKSMEVT